MKVTLKKLSIYERMSEETTAFVADVCVDGKRVAHAKNDGHGGATTVDWDCERERRDEIEAELKKAVPAEYRSYTSGAEWAVDRLVEAAAQAKEDARVARAVAKNDAQFKKICAKRGTGAARFRTPEPGGATTRWVEFRKDTKDGEAAARAAAQKQYGTISDWTVVA